MRYVISLAIVVLTFTLPVYAQTVSNVRFSQRTDGSRLVDVYYDVSGVETGGAVEIRFSFDRGRTFTPAATVAGDAGTGVTSGSDRHAIWNAGKDAPGKEASCVVKVVYAPPPPWNKVGMEFVSIPGGSFQMGYEPVDEEKPVHTVTLSPFEMGKYEVTRGQYRGAKSPQEGDNLPRDYVSWWDAIKFCNALSRKAGLPECYNETTGECDFTKDGFRLPTEAEWEYACRAGTSTAFNLGEYESDLARAGWYYANCSTQVHPVGQKTPNAWGLYDMHGNVFEWCYDVFGTYLSTSQTNPTGAVISGYYRVVRGGCWSRMAGNCRSTSRYSFPPDSRPDCNGFRVVRGAL